VSQPQQLALMATPKKERTVDLICGAFDLTDRRKFELTDLEGNHIVDLYFKPITRSVRIRAMEAAGNDNALKISTIMLCLTAELEDGTRAFSEGDALKLQREMHEKKLDELELFLHELDQGGDLEEAKNG